ncbi:MAG: sigma-70 family RNA polymerase sigma factor [Planctomycetales bacterium]
MTRVDEAARQLAAARGGSADALGQVLGDCQAYLLLIARHELSADLQAKCGPSDLVQETLLEACRDFSQFHGATYDEFLAWLRRLLLNNVSNVRRRYRTGGKRKVALEVRPGSGNRLAKPFEIIDALGETPSEHAIENEQEQAMVEAIARLPGDYQRVLLLRYKDELPFESIAQMIGRSVNATEKLWLRAVERLRREMRRKDEG